MANKNIILNFPHPDAVSTTIRYARIDNTPIPIYTTIPNVAGTTYIIQNVPDGQYRIFFKPNYADGRTCNETMLDTPACTGITAFNVTISEGEFVVSYTADTNVPYVQVNVSYPNGGFTSTQSINTGADIFIPIPGGLTGDFIFTMQPVCDVDSGFLGVATAPAIVTVPPTPNSQFTNSTGNPLTNVSGVSYDGGAALLFTSANVNNAATINFFIADGNYTSIVINFTGSVATASLVTGTGTYSGVISGGTATFTAVTMSSGAVITLS